jgi:hypothetical protein
VVSGATGTCPHANGNFNTANGSTTVQLAPFGPTDNPGGEYKVYLIPIGSGTIDTDGLHLLFSDKDAKTDNFKVLCSTTGGCGGQPQQPMISGYKWYDTNTNGVYDSGEPVIPGWRINATDGSTNLMSWTYTGANGYYTIPADSNNTYTIAEIFPNSTWIATACVGAASQSGGASTICNSNTSASVSTGTTTNILGPNFGNVCTGAGGGLTLGFWSNPNGQRILSSDSGWAAFLDALNLRGATGATFDPSTLSGFKSWLLSATATNMAYMLSAQLATMELNVRENDVSASSLIYAPGTSSANAAGFATVAAIMTEANNELGLHGSTLSGSLYRNYQQSLKNALDQANNNFNFVQAGPASCPFSTPY